MFQPRLLRSLGAFAASAALVLSGSLAAHAAPSQIAEGTYGDCPVKLWSDGTLEFTCTVLTNHPDYDADTGGWRGDFALYMGSFNYELGDKITRVKSGPIAANGSLTYLFDNMEKLTDISALAQWDTSKVTNMLGMFWNASSLTTANGLRNGTPLL